MERKSLKTEDYYNKAYNFATETIKKTFKPFACEDVKDLFHELYEEPNETRIWGNIFQTLKREGRIVFKGYRKCTSKKGHGHPVTVWISIEYSKKQQLNRKANGKQQTTLEL